MNLADYLRRQFAYDEWANREVLAAIRRAGASNHASENPRSANQRSANQRSLQLMSHILAAELVWLERLKQQPQSVPVWPEPDLAQCEAQAAKMGGLWLEFLDLITAGDVSQSISYKNSKGEEWTSTIVDVLTHVLMHSAYHRGQIATHMRASGETPAYTDFIHGVRQGLFQVE
ncbi:MAG: DinB family protein [Candidatus Sulfotelmatobacter sp.]